mmetsp:Transcript_13450/g.26096  ORF Transcript_13450/g.26096 Transcript_13450/m.26096 type:complete len:304 (+) Transcript_13450:39-950(+)
MNVLRSLLLLCGVGCGLSADYTARPFGFSMTEEPEAEKDSGITVFVKVNVTEADIFNITRPGLKIRFMKSRIGEVKLFIKKDEKPSIDGSDTAIKDVSTCTGVSMACWDDGTLKNITTGIYWVGFAGSCTACLNSVDLYHITATITDSAGNDQPYLVRKTDRCYWTAGYQITENVFKKPYAKVVLKNTTNVYVELDSLQDLQKATVQLVFSKDKPPTVWPTTESDTIQTYPHPGGSTVSGEWKTGAYSLSAGTWYIAAYGGDTTTDYRLTYGIGQETCSNVAYALQMSFAALASSFVVLATFL